MRVNPEAKIKLMILTPTLECGGSEKFVSLVCEHINTNIFSVCLVVVNNAHPFYSVKNPLVKVVNLRKERVLFSLPAIKKEVASFKPDIIFSTANHLNLYLAIFKSRFDSHIQFIAREASIVSISSTQARMPALYNRLIKKYYRRFDMIICQSVFMQQDLQSHYHVPLTKLIIIHNATEEVLHVPGPSLPHNGPLYKFITVARLSEEKGIERLIQAVSLLSVPFKYYIIGEGSKLAGLQKLVVDLGLQDKVFLVGQKSIPFAGMEDADLLLMGSYYEGFPNAVLEAAAHGIPVVAFNVPGGISEIITPHENGLLVNDKDPLAFAEAIQAALAKKFDRHQIIATTKMRFSVTGMMRETENLFLKLTQNK